MIRSPYTYQKAMIALYYLLIHADGKVTDRELKMGAIMRQHEGISDDSFELEINAIKASDNEEGILNACVSTLKTCELPMKARCIAWLSLIANSDGFMDRKEWGMIYRIYAKELGLSLESILDEQKSLPRK